MLIAANPPSVFALPQDVTSSDLNANTSSVDNVASEVELSTVELATDLHDRLLDDDLKDIYNEIIRLDSLAQTQVGEEKYQTLETLLDYYFWLDEAEGIKKTVAEMQEIVGAHEQASSRGIYQKLYLQYAEVVDDADHGKAIEGFVEELKKAYEIGDLYSQAIAYEMIGSADGLFGNYYTAVEKLQLALDALDGLDDMRADRIRVGVYLAYAYVYTSLENDHRAIDYYKMAIELSQARGFAVDHGGIIYNIGFLLLQSRNLDMSEKFFYELEARYLKVGDPDNLIFPYYALAFINYHREDYVTSLEFAEKSYRGGDTVVDFAGTLLQLIAENNAWLGNLDLAYKYLEQASEYFEKYPDYKGTVWEATSLRVEAAIAHAEGRHDDAMQKYADFHHAHAKAQNSSFTTDFELLTDDLQSRISSQQAELALKQITLNNQRYLSAFIAFLLLIMVGLILFQLRWSKILRLSKMDAEQASRSKSEFLAQMSHELRTPLNAIIGFSEMMSKEVLGEIANKKYKEYVVLINQSGLHLLRIINDILDISKVESGKLELSESKFDLCELIDETVDTMHNRAARVGVELVNSAPEKCSLLYADRRIIKQVLFNILSNSIKFTDKGGAISISYSVQNDGKINLVISDTGQGMSPEHLMQAMEPFGQVKSVLVQSHEGTGLGLPLVKAFMELHQGDMDISSKLGEGTKFELHFPAERVL